MTDLEKFVELYKSFGIELEVKEEDTHYAIIMEADTHPKFEGYNTFYSDVTFDTDGNFLTQGFWE